MKMKIIDVLNLNEIIQELTQVQTRATTAFKINKISKACANEIIELNQSKIFVAEKYCLRDEDGTPKLTEQNMYQFDTEKENLVRQELEELLEMDVELSVPTLTMDDLENIKLTAQEASWLAVIMEE